MHPSARRDSFDEGFRCARARPSSPLRPGPFRRPCRSRVRKHPNIFIRRARFAEGGPCHFRDGSFSSGNRSRATFHAEDPALRERDPWLKDPGRFPHSRCIKRRITRCPFQDVQGTSVCGKSSSSLSLSLIRSLSRLRLQPPGPAGVYRAGRGIIFAVLPIQLCVR